MNSTGEIYEFGPFQLEASERRLLRDGQAVPLRAKVFDTLLTLLANHGRLVTKSDLMRAVWPDSVVEEGNLARNLTELRKALVDDKAVVQHYIETVPGKGYRFIANVSVLPAAGEHHVGTQHAPRAESSWEDRLSAARAEIARKSLVTATWVTATGVTATGEEFTSHVVGREQEMRALLSALDGTLSGRLELVCVVGEPGIGKTTLVERFRAECRMRGTVCVFAVGKCSERLAESEAYLPVLEALESLLTGDWAAECAELMKLVAPTWYVQVAPLWASAEPSFAGIIVDAKAASRERMKRELAAFFEELSRAVPLVVFIDDLHWADASTTELLVYLSRRLASTRVLVIVAYRFSDMVHAGHPFVTLRQELKRQNLCREVPMGLLSQTDIEQYLRLEISAQSLPDGFAEFIHSRTEGNPLFMAELIRHLRERNTLEQPPDSSGLPESIRSVIERRMSHLNADQLALLAVAAVQGQEFDSLVIADVMNVDAATVEERLHQLEHVHAFVRKLHQREFPDFSVSVTYSWAHVLYLHAIEETITPNRMISLSRAAAEALLSRHPQHSGQVAARLGMLFEAGRSFERAADFFISAAANAARLYANEVAVTLSRRAMANAEKLSGSACHSRIAAAALQLGQLQMALSRFADAELDFEKAASAAKTAADVEGQVNAICAQSLAQFYQRNMEGTRDTASRALSIASAEGSKQSIAAAEAILGLEQLCYGALDRAEESFHRSVPILIQRPPSPHALEAVTFSGLLRSWQLDYESSHKITDWALRHARDQGSAYHIVLTLFVRGMTLFNEGRLSDGIRDLQEGMRLAEKNGERFWLSRFPNTLGWVHRELQDLDTAMSLDRLGVQTARENGYAKPEAYSHVNLAQDYMALGDTTHVLEHLNRATELFGADVWFRWRYHMRAKAELARYWLVQGDHRKAQAYASESIAIAEPRKTRKHLAWGYKILGDVALAEERMEDAHAQYQTALDLLERYRNPLIHWRVLHAAAEAASARHDSDLADQYRRRCRQVINSLAESLTDGQLRRQFLGSRPIRQALA